MEAFVLTVVCIMFDTEKFIYIIEKQPPLYDFQSKDYSNRQLKAKCWSEVGEAIYDNWKEKTPEEKDKAGKELMKKWKTLRDNFVRDFRLLKKTETGVPANKKKKYVYFDQLSFLIANVKGCENTASNITPPEEQPDRNDQARDESENNEPEAIVQQNPANLSSTREKEQRLERAKKRPTIGRAVASASKSITDIMNESLAIQKGGMDSDKFGNKAFLLSFVPTMDHFPPQQAFDIRLQITKLFRNAVLNAGHTSNDILSRTDQPPRPFSAASTSVSSYAAYSSEPDPVATSQVYEQEQSFGEDYDSQPLSESTQQNSPQFNISEYLQMN